MSLKKLLNDWKGKILRHPGLPDPPLPPQITCGLGAGLLGQALGQGLTTQQHALNQLTLASKLGQVFGQAPGLFGQFGNPSPPLGLQALQGGLQAFGNQMAQRQVPGQAFGAAPLSQREVPCPRCYQPMYYRSSFDVLGCNRCQLWVTKELACVSYIEEWGHWADA